MQYKIKIANRQYSEFTIYELLISFFCSCFVCRCQSSKTTRGDRKLDNISRLMDIKALDVDFIMECRWTFDDSGQNR